MLVKPRGVFVEATDDPVALPKRGVWLYHCTYFGRLRDIMRAGGLAPGHGRGGASFGPQYAAWSRGKMFVARSSRVAFWYGRLDAWAEHSGPEFPDLDDPEDLESRGYYDQQDAAEKWVQANKSWTVVVLRYRDHGRWPWSPDYREDHEHRDDYYWTDPKQKVPVKYLSVFDPLVGGAWMPRLDRSSLNELDGSLDELADDALSSDPSGFAYDYSPNLSGLLSSV